MYDTSLRAHPPPHTRSGFQWLCDLALALALDYTPRQGAGQRSFCCLGVWIVTCVLFGRRCRLLCLVRLYVSVI